VASTIMIDSDVKYQLGGASAWIALLMGHSVITLGPMLNFLQLTSLISRGLMIYEGDWVFKTIAKCTLAMPCFTIQPLPFSIVSRWHCIVLW